MRAADHRLAVVLGALLLGPLLRGGRRRGPVQDQVEAVLVGDLVRAGRDQLLDQVERIIVVACGTSYHAGLIAKYVIEQWARFAARVGLLEQAPDVGAAFAFDVAGGG